MHNREQTALITGSSRGIGKAIALRLAQEGVFTYINCIKNKTAADETLHEIFKVGGKGALLMFDIANNPAVTDAFETIIQNRQQLDILVNNAGITTNKMFVRMTEEEWNLMINANLTGTFFCCREAAKYMMKQRYGRIINISSVVAEAGNAGQTGYSASKAGIIGLTKSLAREFGPRNICINTITPGLIETDMTVALPDKNKKPLLSQIPLGRAGQPSDIAGVVAFLVSEEASYITGQTIRVNGGLYM